MCLWCLLWLFPAFRRQRTELQKLSRQCFIIDCFYYSLLCLLCLFCIPPSPRSPAALTQRSRIICFDLHNDFPAQQGGHGTGAMSTRLLFIGFIGVYCVYCRFLGGARITAPQARGRHLLFIVFIVIYGISWNLDFIGVYLRLLCNWIVNCQGWGAWFISSILFISCILFILCILFISFILYILFILFISFISFILHISSNYVFYPFHSFYSFYSFIHFIYFIYFMYFIYIYVLHIF